MYEKVKRFYDKGLYSKEQVHRFVEKGVLTEEEYRSIVEGLLHQDEVSA